MSSDMGYGITAHYHHAGLYLVTKKGQIGLLHCLRSGGWRNPIAFGVVTATLLPILRNKAWGGRNRFQHKVNIMLMVCWSQSLQF